MSSSIAASTKSITDNLAQSGNQAVHAATKAAHAIKNGNAGAIDCIQELGREYQSITTRNFEWMTQSIQRLAAVKSPTDFMELQRKFLEESMATAMADGQRIFKMTSAVFAAAVQPPKFDADLRNGNAGN